ncbi:hypothetical protein [Niallia sp. 03190]|uniref:hypothetical protein n=1 Tax=Niallia sp. 03190 TaxID=3458061 RepID=UPI0040446AE4
MAIYFIEMYLFKEIVKWNNGNLSIEEMEINESTDMTTFVDKLIINEKMDYHKECIPAMLKIEEFVREHRNRKYSLNSACL